MKESEEFSDTGGLTATMSLDGLGVEDLLEVGDRLLPDEFLLGESLTMYLGVGLLILNGCLATALTTVLFSPDAAR